MDVAGANADDGVGVGDGETVGEAAGIPVAALLLRTTNTPTTTNKADRDNNIIKLGAPFSKIRLLPFSDRLRDFLFIQGANISLFSSSSSKL